MESNDNRLALVTVIDGTCDALVEYDLTIHLPVDRAGLKPLPRVSTDFDLAIDELENSLADIEREAREEEEQGQATQLSVSREYIVSIQNALAFLRAFRDGVRGYRELREAFKDVPAHP